MDERWMEVVRDAESAERLLALARAEGVELSEERAAALFEKYHAAPPPQSGEVFNEELNDVSGGGCGGGRMEPNFQVGDHVRFPGYVACEGKPGFPCRADYIVVDRVWYNEPFHDYYYEVTCPKCGMCIQTFEQNLRPA